MARYSLGNLKNDLVGHIATLNRRISSLASDATKIFATNEAEKLAEKLFSEVTREDLDKPDTVIGLLAALLAALPNAARREFLEGLEHFLNKREFGHTLAGKIVAGLLEGTDDGIRTMMAREQIKEKDAMNALKVFMENAKDTITSRVTGTGDSMSHPPAAHGKDHKTDDHGHDAKPHGKAAAVVANLKNEEPDWKFDLKSVVKLTAPEFHMLAAFCEPARREAQGDTTDEAFLGLARQFLAGCKMTFGNPEIVDDVKKHLPRASEGGAVTMDDVRRIEANPMNDADGKRFVHAMVLMYVMSVKDRIPPNIADMGDAAFNLGKFKAWVAGKQQSAKESEAPEAPNWVSKVKPYVYAVVGVFGLSNAVLAILLYCFAYIGIVSLATGVIMLVALSIAHLQFMPAWMLAWIVLSLGVPSLFCARAIGAMFDSQLTLALMPFRAVPENMKELVAKLGISFSSERDVDSPRAVFKVFRDYATLIIIIAAAGNIGISIIASGSMMETFGGAATIGGALLFGNFTAMFAFIMAESKVRASKLYAMEPAITKWEKTEKLARIFRMNMLSLFSGVMMGICATTMIIIVVHGTFSTVACAKVAADRQAISEAYLTTVSGQGRDIAAFCDDFPSDESCQRCE